jgi:hypothetical protein
MDRQRIVGAGKPVGERHPERTDGHNRSDRAMDAVREVVNEGEARKPRGRASGGVGKAMDAVREVVNEEKK